MAILDHLEPKRVFYYFEEICKIPHGSHHTKQISDYCVSFAKKHHLEWYQDKDNNVIIRKEASKGYENSKAVILQGHLDMVCEKEEHADIDMNIEGLKLQVNGDEISAIGTTLGGDDGIAIAMTLAILEQDQLSHPCLEAVFTVDEEVGMEGASSIDVTPLQGKMMLNIDSEEEKVFTVGCAGGNTAECILPIKKERIQGETYKISVTGLIGGHSGIEINKGRANATVLLGRALQEASYKSEIHLIEVNGGLKDNAIPREAYAIVAVKSENDLFCLKEFETILQKEYHITDPGIQLTVAKANTDALTMMDTDTTEKAIYMLTCLPNGVQRMSADVVNLVETSLNMGIVKTREDSLSISFCVRSNVNSQREMLNRRLKQMMDAVHGKIELLGAYDAWEYRSDSKLRDLMVKVFKQQYQEEPRIELVHAGVECGIFSTKIEGLDCVSFGPNLSNIHTTQEKMSISSVERVYQFMIEVLKQMR